MMNFAQDNIGAFQEKDYGKWFTYRETWDEWARSNGFMHEIDVMDALAKQECYNMGIRYGNVKKTVVYIVVDEAADGSPVIEQWHIKKHEVYQK